MTQPTSNLVELLEGWEDGDCFPAQEECPFPNSRFVCTSCVFSPVNRTKYINQLKLINLLEIDHVDVSKIRKDD